jgi:hypothetical protein
MSWEVEQYFWQRLVAVYSVADRHQELGRACKTSEGPWLQRSLRAWESYRVLDVQRDVLGKSTIRKHFHEMFSGATPMTVPSVG